MTIPGEFARRTVDRRWGAWIVFSFLLVTCTSLIYHSWLWGFALPADRSGFGDSYGALNTIYSGLAFATLVVTLWMQREELALQSEQLRLQVSELESTRGVLQEQQAEMAAQRDLLAQQLETAKLRDRVATLHGLLASHAQLRDELRRASSSGETSGRSDLRSVLARFKERIGGDDSEYDTVVAAWIAATNQSPDILRLLSSLVAVATYLQGGSVYAEELDGAVLAGSLTEDEVSLMKAYHRVLIVAERSSTKTGVATRRMALGHMLGRLTPHLMWLDASPATRTADVST